MNSEQQERIYQQWNSLMFQPSASQQPSSKINDHFSTERNTLTSSHSSKEPFSSNAITFRKMFSPPQMYDNESMKDMSGISLNDIPLPPKPDFLMQNKESDNLETFNIKRADPDPVQSLRSGRPHLASPSEFFSQSRPGQDSGVLNGQLMVILLCSDRLPLSTIVYKFLWKIKCWGVNSELNRGG